MTDKRTNDSEAETIANEEAKGWFKWTIFAFVAFPVAALLFVILPKLDSL